MAITNVELLQTLKSLAEGTLEPDAWRAWWKKNGSGVEALVGATSAARLQPKPKSLASEAAFNSQNEAMVVLKKSKVRVKRSMCYFECYVKESDAREADQAGLLKPRINLLKEKLPHLHACLFRNAKKIEKFEPGASEQEVVRVEKTLKAKLPKPIREFFKTTKHFAVEGLELDLEQVFVHPGDKNAPDGKRYVCLGNYFWKDDGDQILVDITAPTSDPKIHYYAHSAPSPKVQPLADSWKAFLEKLPKQYLNQMFYYS
jgi:hypothetical protein